MSQVRVHNFSISLDGFGTGEGLTFDAPSGHAGHRLHEWVFPTHFGRSVIMGQSGGTTGVDNVFAERLNVGFGAEIMGRGKFGPQTGPWTDLGIDDEWRGWWGRTRRSTRRCSCSRTIRARRSRWRVAPCSTSSMPLRQEAPDLARQAAGELDVRIGGGPTVVLSPSPLTSSTCSTSCSPPSFRPWCSTVARPRRRGGALQQRGNPVTERCHPSDLHVPTAPIPT